MNRGQDNICDHDEYKRRPTSDTVGHQNGWDGQERPEPDDGRNVADCRVFDAESALDLWQSQHHDGCSVTCGERCKGNQRQNAALTLSKLGKREGTTNAHVGLPHVTSPTDSEPGSMPLTHPHTPTATEESQREALGRESNRYSRRKIM